MSKCRFVVTQYADDFAYNFCLNVHDDPKMAAGEIMMSILEGMDNNEDEEVRIKFEHDDANDSFYDVICVQPENKNHSTLTDIYRVFYLRDEEIRN